MYIVPLGIGEDLLYGNRMGWTLSISKRQRTQNSVPFTGSFCLQPFFEHFIALLNIMVHAALCIRLATSPRLSVKTHELVSLKFGLNNLFFSQFLSSSWLMHHFSLHDV